jgi:hypothetical protein
VRARTPDGGTYQGTVTIARSGDTYALSWQLAREKYSGVGILREGVLSVGWGGGDVGVVAYRAAETTLDGVWAASGGTHSAARC